MNNYLICMILSMPSPSNVLSVINWMELSSYKSILMKVTCYLSKSNCKEFTQNLKVVPMYNSRLAQKPMLITGMHEEVRFYVC